MFRLPVMLLATALAATVTAAPARAEVAVQVEFTGTMGAKCSLFEFRCYVFMTSQTSCTSVTAGDVVPPVSCTARFGGSYPMVITVAEPLLPSDCSGSGSGTVSVTDALGRSHAVPVRVEVAQGYGSFAGTDGLGVWSAGAFAFPCAVTRATNAIAGTVTDI